MKTFKILLLIMLTTVSNQLFCQTNPTDPIVGTWLTAKKDAHVSITKVGSYYYGRVIWLKDPKEADGSAKVDYKNPDKSLQKTPIIGLKILSGFEKTGANKWENGSIYDPDNGKTYSCVITYNANKTLNIRGYIGVSLIGRTDVWTMVN